MSEYFIKSDKPSITQSIKNSIEKRWYSQTGNWNILDALWPLESLFKTLASKRRLQLESKQQIPKLPIVVVGNITVGGTGKTPFIIAFIQLLKVNGYSPAVVSRGYAVDKHTQALLIQPDDCKSANGDARRYGDEPVLISNICQVPVAVAVNRVEGCELLEANTDCDIIISDDGLQHYTLARHLEIVMVDGLRLFGNQRLLPCGPLRESPTRLATANLVVVNYNYDRQRLENEFDALVHTNTNLSAIKEIVHGVSIQGNHCRNLLNKQILSLDEIDRLSPLTAIAGIANPAKFFHTLKRLGCELLDEISYDDHYNFVLADFEDLSGENIIMTAKDAVKCSVFIDELAQRFPQKNFWVLEISMILPQPLQESLLELVASIDINQLKPKST